MLRVRTLDSIRVADLEKSPTEEDSSLVSLERPGKQEIYSIMHYQIPAVKQT
jgi:hypothetical protein